LSKRYDPKPRATGTKLIGTPAGDVLVDAGSLVRSSGRVVLILEPHGRVRAFGRLGEVVLSPDECDRIRAGFGRY
jgi:hypothetical protein